MAKNYLGPAELDALNRIVSLYLDFAELQALNRRAMYMRDWVAKLDDFLRLSERDILTHVGTVSHDDALAKAHAEYTRFRVHQTQQPTPVEQHFREAIAHVRQLRENTHQPNAKSSALPPHSPRKNPNTD